MCSVLTFTFLLSYSVVSLSGRVSLSPGSFLTAALSAVGGGVANACFYLLFGLYDGFFARGAVLHTLYPFRALGGLYGSFFGLLLRYPFRVPLYFIGGIFYVPGCSLFYSFYCLVRRGFFGVVGLLYFVKGFYHRLW